MDGKAQSVSAVAKKDFYVVEKQGNQTEAKIRFKSSQSQFKAPLKSGTNVGLLQYSDPEKIGRGYLEDQEPTVEMVAEKKRWEEFFLEGLVEWIRPLCQWKIISKKITMGFDPLWFFITLLN